MVPLRRIVLLSLFALSTWHLAAMSLAEQGSTESVSAPAAKSVAELELERILARQQRVFDDLNTVLADADEQDRRQPVEALDTEFKAFILENPDYVYGYILYGKFLRSIDRAADAAEVFLKANELGDFAVVKQQIGTYLAEEGDYALALPYLLSAVELEPKTAVYHYQLGELLYTYRQEFIKNGQLTAELIDHKQFKAFAQAARLAPDNRTLQYRFAESFFDCPDPDWTQALEQWQRLETTADSPVERQIIRLQKARVYAKLGDSDQALALLETVNHPSLSATKQQLKVSLSALKND